MRFDLNNLNPGTWIDIDECQPQLGALCLRVLNDDTRRKLEAKHTIRKFVRGRQVETLNDSAFNADMWDYCIVDWKNICDAEGNQISCTAMNKALLMAESPVFTSLVSDLLDQLNSVLKERAEEAEKN
ncbi:hypothetical protein [Oleidesulfovibrio sp.]|uniref:hypothetical protein n=1 Tax=Oleidesulfovibrio sp. TaxID=2909707 RepID=UPI003A874A4A